MPAAGLIPIPPDQLTDWFSTPLRSAYIDALTPGCTVRVCVSNTHTNAWEKIYFKITKIKDGTYWGTAQDIYRMDENAAEKLGVPDAQRFGLKNGEEFTFRRRDIMEIPLEKWWQPKSYVKAVGHLGEVKTREDSDG